MLLSVASHDVAWRAVRGCGPAVSLRAAGAGGLRTHMWPVTADGPVPLVVRPGCAAGTRRRRAAGPPAHEPCTLRHAGLRPQSAAAAGDPFFHEVVYSTLVDVGASRQLLGLDSRSAHLEPFL